MLFSSTQCSHWILCTLLTCYTEECLVPKSGQQEIVSSAPLGIRTDPKTSKYQPSTVGKYIHYITQAGKNTLRYLEYLGNRMGVVNSNSSSMIVWLKGCYVCDS